MKLSILILLIANAAHAAPLTTHPHDPVKPDYQYEVCFTGKYKHDCPVKELEKIDCTTDSDCAAKGVKYEVTHNCNVPDLDYYF